MENLKEWHKLQEHNISYLTSHIGTYFETFIDDYIGNLDFFNGREAPTQETKNAMLYNFRKARIENLSRCIKRAAELNEEYKNILGINPEIDD